MKIAYKPIFVKEKQRNIKLIGVIFTLLVLMYAGWFIMNTRIETLERINDGYYEHMMRLQEENMELKRLNSSQAEKHLEQVGWTGIASWYSRDGCVGCSPNLHMANGQPLDDNAKTVAFNKLPLGTEVVIRNLKNNMITTAIVTDRGGFERLGRIIDITPAVRDALSCGGLCKVKITIK